MLHNLLSDAVVIGALRAKSDINFTECLFHDYSKYLLNQCCIIQVHEWGGGGGGVVLQNYL